MPYTFGAGTGDDINFNDGVSAGGTQTAWLITGWWLPTTLTAGRGLWNLGSTSPGYGAEINSSDTSELTLRSNAGTDGEWSTTGVGFTQDQWKFLAFAGSTLNGGSPIQSYRVWAGTADTAPVEVTLNTVVSPSGTTGTAGILYIGNGGTGTVAFQGDIALITFYTTGGSGVTGPNSGLAGGPATFGQFSQDEADTLFRTYVIPNWRGDFRHLFYYPRMPSTATECRWMIPLDGRNQAVGVPQRSVANNPPFVALTINGAVVSQNRPPRAVPPNFFFNTRRR